jgi:signal transduction histidine kinase
MWNAPRLWWEEVAVPTVAEFIHHHQQTIIASWLQQVRVAASARDLGQAALENVMPRFLASLAVHLATGDGAADKTHRRKLLQSHLSTRLRQGYDLAEIVGELGALGRCIERTWADRPASERPAEEDIERLHVEIHTSITDASDTFHHHMLEDEQSEKRYLRRLQAIASAALAEPPKPLRDRLCELLQVVMDAMDAHCAAYLGYSVNEQQLVLTAWTGSDALEPYATSLDAKSFVTQLAFSDDPSAVFDAKATPLDIPDDLRFAGIQSLLGVRLPLHHDLLGAVYVGSEARELTPREVRRIEALGERLALHLEHVRLFAELADKVEALRIEKAMRERFVSILVHDLRAPLATARLAADTLSHETASAETRRIAPKITASIERVDRMIRDLLDANRIRAGERIPLHLEPTEMVAIVDDVAAEARALYGDRFIVDARRRVHGVWSHDELHRALWNLVTNAVKYGDCQRPIMISIEEGKHTVRLSVHNEGPPIPAQELPAIFDAYTRCRSAAAGNHPGWGLGLTLVRGCAHAHGGTVDVISRAGDGTTFTMELPLDARAAHHHGVSTAVH